MRWTECEQCGCVGNLGLSPLDNLGSPPPALRGRSGYHRVGRHCVCVSLPRCWLFRASRHAPPSARLVSAPVLCRSVVACATGTWRKGRVTGGRNTPYSGVGGRRWPSSAESTMTAVHPGSSGPRLARNRNSRDFGCFRAAASAAFPVHASGRSEPTATRPAVAQGSMPCGAASHAHDIPPCAEGRSRPEMDTI